MFAICLCKKNNSKKDKAKNVAKKVQGGWKKNVSLGKNSRPSVDEIQQNI